MMKFYKFTIEIREDSTVKITTAVGSKSEGTIITEQIGQRHVANPRYAEVSLFNEWFEAVWKEFDEKNDENASVARLRNMEVKQQVKQKQEEMEFTARMIQKEMERVKYRPQMGVSMIRRSVSQPTRRPTPILRNLLTQVPEQIEVEQQQEIPPPLPKRNFSTSLKVPSKTFMSCVSD